jgi:hypothetical protein
VRAIDSLGSLIAIATTACACGGGGGFTPTNTTTPGAVGQVFRDTGRRITPSIRKNRRCPPSRTGIGKRFTIARFRLTSPIMKRKFDAPASAAFPAMS